VISVCRIVQVYEAAGRLTDAVRREDRGDGVRGLRVAGTRAPPLRHDHSGLGEWSRRLWLEDDLTWYSASAGRELTSPRALFVTHHQTHHRGEMHAQLTGFGSRICRLDRTFAQAEAGQRLLHVLLATMQFAE